MTQIGSVNMIGVSRLNVQLCKPDPVIKEVIKIKKTFYNSSFAKYDDCLNGKLRLIPDDNHLKLLQADFNNMLENKMFYGNQPNFGNILSEIKNLERLVN